MAQQNDAPDLGNTDPRITPENAGAIPATSQPDGIPDINLKGFRDVDGVPEGAALASEDNTPMIKSMTAVHQPNNTTIITARYSDSAAGWVNKHFVLPGIATAQQIASALGNIANW